MNLKELYNTNDTFKRYVDLYIQDKGSKIDVDTALSHLVVQAYAETLKQNFFL